MNAPLPSPLQAVADHPGHTLDIRLYLKRDDLLHPAVSGNKWRKLEPVIRLIREGRYAGIVTCGGPYSNHLQAVAAAGQVYGFPTVGLVRGIAADLQNPTLQSARSCGMQLVPVSKQAYARRNEEPALKTLTDAFPGYYLLPEGGATALATDNCRPIATEILEQLPAAPHHPLFVCVPAGTGCTAAGVIAGLGGAGETWIFPAASYGVDASSMQHFLSVFSSPAPPAYRLIHDYTFGRFAVCRPELIEFVRHFQQRTGCLLDPIYTAKMMFGLFDLLDKEAFPAGSTVVAVHTGGLQGWAGFRQRFGVHPDEW